MRAIGRMLLKRPQLFVARPMIPRLQKCVFQFSSTKSSDSNQNSNVKPKTIPL